MRVSYVNKLSLYILLVLVYLGLSKSFTTEVQGTIYVESEKVLPGFFQGAPLEVVLVDSFERGLLIKSYFHTYRLVYAFRSPETVVVRTSGEFWSASQKNLGMSLFQRRERDMMELLVPAPPGMLFVGDLAFGHWETENSGTRVWSFHRAYQHFPSLFGWGDFVPDFEFYGRSVTAATQGMPYYGEKEEFGEKGRISQGLVKEYRKEASSGEKTVLQNLKKYLVLPWNRNEGKVP